MIKVGSDFIGIDYEEVFACDMDKYARQTFCLNYGTENDLMLSKLDTLGKTTISAKDYSFYYPKNVYEREIPKESLDIYMTSPPCQSFSLAGKRMGKEDKRGVLFFNSLEFIQENKPRYFIFENVKGLLSHDKVDKTAEYGRTFQEWSNYLGGKSVNGVHTFFPYEDSVPYHIYFQVLNAKHYGIPQNRERIFIIGIRDDEDNNFQFPKPFPLEKRLKDVLESEVDEKYFLSDKMVKVLQHHQNKIVQSETPNESGCIHAGYFKMGGRDQQYVKDELNQVASLYENNADAGRVYDTNSVSCTLKSDGGGGGAKTGLYLVDTKQKANFGNKRLNETLNNNEVPEQDCIIDSYNKSFHTEVSPSILTTVSSANMHHVKIGAIRGRNPENPKSRQSGLETEQMLEINENGTSNALTTVQKDNVVVIPAPIVEFQLTGGKWDKTHEQSGRVYDKNGISPTIHTMGGGNQEPKIMTKQQIEKFNDLEVDENIAGCITHAIGRMGSSDEYISSVKRNAIITQRIRRLTPRECFNLMDFNQEMIDKTIESKLISDSQLYKQAGNSICVGVLAAIIEKINL